MALQGNPLIDDEFTIQEGVTMTLLENPKRVHIHSVGTVPFNVPSHWHAAHDELHTVIQGRIEITQNGVSRIVGPEDGVVLTQRGVVHSLRTFEGEEVILVETALPNETTTEQKQLFFRNMFALGVVPSFLALMQVFYYGDAYPAFPRGFRWLESSFVVLLGGYLAPLFGHQLPDKRLKLDEKRFPPSTSKKD